MTQPLPLLVALVIVGAAAQTALFPTYLSSHTLSSGVNQGGSVSNMYSLSGEPEGQSWSTNSWYWNDNDGGHRYITWYATQPLELTSFYTQFDCNDNYLIEFREVHTQTWFSYTTVGARTCPGLRQYTVGVGLPLADAFRLSCTGGDLSCSVSRFSPVGYVAQAQFTTGYSSSRVASTGTYYGTSAYLFQDAYQAEGTSWNSQSIYWHQDVSDSTTYFPFVGHCTVRTLSVHLDCNDNYVVDLFNYDTGLWENVNTYGATTCPGLRVRQQTITNGHNYAGFRVRCYGGDQSCSISRVSLRGACDTTKDWLVPFYGDTPTATGTYSGAAQLAPAHMYSVHTSAENTVWNVDSVYWTQSVSNVYINLPFVGTAFVSRVYVHADCNDDYVVEYYDNGGWHTLFTTSQLSCPGLRMRVYTPSSPVTTSQLRVHCTVSDNSCSVSRVLSFGTEAQYCCSATYETCASIHATCSGIDVAGMNAACSADASLCTIASNIAQLYSVCTQIASNCDNLISGC